MFSFLAELDEWIDTSQHLVSLAHKNDRNQTGSIGTLKLANKYFIYWG